jgi:hypothetical protein
VFGIISRNGAQHVKSKPRFLSRKFSHLHSRLTTPEELFNLCHSQAHNCVERIFGITKRRFGVFSHAPECPIEPQAKLVPAITALHNFLCIHDRTDEASDLGQNSLGREHSSSIDGFVHDSPVEPRVVTPEELGMHITEAEQHRASACRDRFAQQMWADYVAYTQDDD